MHALRGERTRRGLIWIAAGGVALTTAAVFVPGAGISSSHREAPLIAAEPAVDNTDLYTWVPKNSPNDVVFVANWFPFEAPAGGPNFFPWSPQAHYDINIDNNGDGQADVVYRWTFFSHYRNASKQFLYNTGQVTSLDDPDLNFYQTYSLKLIRPGHPTATLLSDAVSAPSHVGDASIPNYNTLRNQATYTVGGLKTFTGQTEDPFFLDLRVFDLLYGGNFGEVGHDSLSGFNTNTIVLQVPKNAVALGGSWSDNPVIGVWSSTDRASTLASAKDPTTLYTGTFVQVSRLGNPLINEAVIPLRNKDKFNATGPATDSQFLSSVTDPILPKVVQAVYGVPAPATPRTDLVEALLTGIYTGSSGPVQADLNSQLLNKDVNPKNFVPGDQLRLNLAVPPSNNESRLGVLGGDLAGFPNGRRLGDDVIDIVLQVAEGVLVPGHPSAVESLGDGVNKNDVNFSNTFPYVALPTSGSDTSPRG